jgi:hypothetical protein
MDELVNVLTWAIAIFEAGLFYFGLVAGAIFLLGLAWAVVTD